MNDVTDVLNMLLAALALGAVLWGFRQRSLLRRLQAGLIALRQGRREHRVRRAPEDQEPVLQAFDALAEQLETTSPSEPPTDSDLGKVLSGLCATLRPPLVAIQSYASLLGQEPALGESAVQREYLQNLNSQVNGLVRLLASSSDLSELRQGLSGLRRDIVQTMSTMTGSTVLLLDREGTASSALTAIAAKLGMRVLVAPGVDAASIMVRAIEPVAIVVNAARADGLGWRALGVTLRNENGAHPPIWLFSLTEDETRGRIWTTREIWLTPLRESQKQRLLEKTKDAHFTVSGDMALCGELMDAFPGRIIAKEHPTDSERGLPAGAGLTLAPAPPFSAGEFAWDVLVFRESELQGNGTQLDVKFRDSLGKETILARDLFETLTIGLDQLADATSTSHTESHTLPQ